MPEPQVNPETVLAPSIIVGQAQQDAALIRQLAALWQDGEHVKAAELVLSNRNLIESQVEEAEQAVVAIKSGWKTSELWSGIAILALNVAGLVLKVHVPDAANITAGTVWAIYTAARTYLKTVHVNANSKSL